jgi:hypothetical protein
LETPVISDQKGKIVHVSLSGLPALVVQVGFVVVFTIPVWFAARLVRAANPTFLRSAISLLVGTAGAFAGVAVGGGLALLIAPVSYVLSFRFILGTSTLGAIMLALVALAGYAAMFHFLGAGIDVHEKQASPLVLILR